MSALTKFSSLERLAFQLALEAPLSQGEYSTHATVDWETIHQVRRELERLGYNWKEGVKVRQRVEREHRIADHAARQARRAP